MFPLLHEREDRLPPPRCDVFGAVMVRSSCSPVFYYEFIGLFSTLFNRPLAGLLKLALRILTCRLLTIPP